jgi:N-acetylmuramoyl-L-alanine amidase
MGNSWNSSVGGIETYFNDGSSTGKRLAECVHAELIKGTQLKNRGVKSDHTLYSTGLYVLAQTYSPAILVECGFMDNPTEAKLMATSQYQQECAKEICQGICNYFGVKYNQNNILDESTIYYVQCGAFHNKVNADNLANQLKKCGFSSIIKIEKTK